MIFFYFTIFIFESVVGPIFSFFYGSAMPASKCPFGASLKARGKKLEVQYTVTVQFLAVETAPHETVSLIWIILVPNKYFLH